jgi:RimJ/RimL family protein N-acetyltransferase
MQSTYVRGSAGSGSPPTVILRNPDIGAPAVARVRLISRDDTDRLERLLSRMSPESRYRRFFTPLPRIPRRLVETLTTVDGDRRVAVAAILDGEIIGMAEYVRSARDEGAAEIAVMVEDRWHRNGLARLLTAELARHATSRGIHRLTASVMAESRPAVAMVRALAPDASIVADGTLVEVAVPLSVVEPDFGGDRRRLACGG